MSEINEIQDLQEEIRELEEECSWILAEEGQKASAMFEDQRINKKRSRLDYLRRVHGIKGDL